MYPEMDEEVAKEAIKQFPDFAKNCIQVLDGYKELNSKLCKSNDKSMKEFNDLCELIVKSLTRYLDNDVPFEERKWCIEKMIELAKMVNDKDSENKHFLKDNIEKFVMMGCALWVIGYSLLGGKATLTIKE